LSRGHFAAAEPAVVAAERRPAAQPVAGARRAAVKLWLDVPPQLGERAEAAVQQIAAIAAAAVVVE
jgi:hypothetical protein